MSKRGFFTGLLYGLLPHTICLAFIVFTALGATFAAAFFRKLLLIRYFFPALVIFSIVFATLSAIIYLRRLGLLSLAGIRRKWRYLLILYVTTLVVNFLFFKVIFPGLANLNSGSVKNDGLVLKVQIPCTGHAPLIISELKSLDGVEVVSFQAPDLFSVNFNSRETSLKEILSLPVFKTYPAEAMK